MPLVTMPPDRGGGGPGGLPGLLAFLSKFPTSDGTPVKAHGEFSSDFSPAFRRLDP